MASIVDRVECPEWAVMRVEYGSTHDLTPVEIRQIDDWEDKVTQNGRFHLMAEDMTPRFTWKSPFGKACNTVKFLVLAD